MKRFYMLFGLSICALVLILMPSLGLSADKYIMGENDAALSFVPEKCKSFRIYNNYLLLVQVLKKNKEAGAIKNLSACYQVVSNDSDLAAAIKKAGIPGTEVLTRILVSRFATCACKKAF
jgi:hypothetical protein